MTDAQTWLHITTDSPLDTKEAAKRIMKLYGTKLAMQRAAKTVKWCDEFQDHFPQHHGRYRSIANWIAWYAHHGIEEEE
jgi:hypothetical protein